MRADCLRSSREEGGGAPLPARAMGYLPKARLLARTLAGAWRPNPPEPDLSAELLARVTPLLVGSGAAALAWWRIRRSGLAATGSAEALRRGYLSQSLRSALHEAEAEQVISSLRSKGIEPILLKGAAAARLYPEPGLRPSGDIDLLIHPHQQAGAWRALRDSTHSGTARVDVSHSVFRGAGAREFDLLYARSQLFRLGATNVRTLGPEDELHFLCLHLLRHSAYRPIWLCDVAAALESAPAGFDWEIALGTEKLKRNWVACVADLARRLLGACQEGLPEAVRSVRAPSWLVAEVLRQWERPATSDHRPREFMSVSLRHPLRALPALVGRWPDPVRAFVGLGLPFDERARMPLQLRFYAAQSAAFLKRPLRRRT